MSAVPPIPSGAARAETPAWSASRERSNLFTVRLMAWIAVHLGRPVARLLLHPIALYFLCFSPAPRRHSARYLARVLGRPPTWAERYRHFHRFASVVLDRVYFARRQMARFALRLDGVPALEALLARGRGAVLLGAHFGSFEALQAVGGEHRMSVAMVMYPHNARMIQRVLQAVAPGFELGIIPIGSADSTLAIRDWLDRGALVGLLADRLPPQAEPSRQGEIECAFLGRPARFATGPLRLAMLLRRPVVLMSATYLGGNRYHVRFEPLADFSEPPAPALREARLREVQRAYVARLEALCREAPFNWFNFYDFWGEEGR